LSSELRADTEELGKIEYLIDLPIGMAMEDREDIDEFFDHRTVSDPNTGVLAGNPTR
jgi:hypothetical protein